MDCGRNCGRHSIKSSSVHNNGNIIWWRLTNTHRHTADSRYPPSWRDVRMTAARIVDAHMTHDQPATSTTIIMPLCHCNKFHRKKYWYIKPQLMMTRVYRVCTLRPTWQVQVTQCSSWCDEPGCRGCHWSPSSYVWPPYLQPKTRRPLNCSNSGVVPTIHLLHIVSCAPIPTLRTRLHAHQVRVQIDASGATVVLAHIDDVRTLFTTVVRVSSHCFADVTRQLWAWQMCTDDVIDIISILKMKTVLINFTLQRLAVRAMSA